MSVQKRNQRLVNLLTQDFITERTLLDLFSEDLVPHDIVSGHTGTGSAFDVVGFTGLNTLGTLTPSANPGASESLLKVGASGLLTLQSLRSGGGNFGADNYASETTGWRITYAGAADFRSIYADEVTTLSFIASVEQALAGSILITKSVTLLTRDFTVPSNTNTGTIFVEDLPGVPNTAVFTSGDWLRIRVIDRSGGGLIATDVWGTVTSYTDLSGGEQSWTFTTQDDGGVSGNLVYAGSIVLDYGGSTQGGYWEATAIGSAVPYSQTVTYSGTPDNPANHTVRTRLGNINGITDADFPGGVTGFGLYSDNAYLKGDLWAASGIVVIDDDGVRVDVNSSGSWSAPRGYQFGDNTTTDKGRLWVQEDSGFRTLWSEVISPSGVNSNYISIRANNTASSSLIELGSSDVQINDVLTIFGNAFVASGIKVGTNAGTIDDTVHVYLNNGFIQNAGILIDQDGSGDSQLTFRLTGTTTWVAGIDNSDSDKFKLGRGLGWGVSESLTITTADNVGIDNGSPITKLTINSTTGTTAGSGEVLRLGGPTSDATFHTQGGHGRFAIAWNAYYDTTAGQWEYIAADPAAIIGFDNSTPGPGTGAGSVHIAASSSGIAGNAITWANGLTVRDNGRVGIGTTVPGYTLEVEDNISGGGYVARIFNDGNNANRHVLWLQGGQDANPTNSFIAFVDGNGDGVGSVAGNGGGVDYNTTSDRRVKEDIRDLSGALEIVAGLRPITYRGLGSDQSSRRSHGLVAQEVQNVLPELVSENENGMLSLDYGRFIPALIGAIKELKERIEALEEAP